MGKYILCLKEKDKLTAEHIIPVTLGSNFVLSNSSCKNFHAQRNKSLEQLFLKGSNFIENYTSTVDFDNRGKKRSVAVHMMGE